jgi:HD domain
MLASIARALEERDQTFGHGDRVAALAEPVAVELGWDRERIRSLRRSAPLHDVGKVKLSPQVLGKPGRLTTEEMAEIRSHPEAGARLVLPLRRFHEALPYVLFHHERWDGGGYPAGRRGPTGMRLRMSTRSPRSNTEPGRSSIRSLRSSSSRPGSMAGTPGTRPSLRSSAKVCRVANKSLTPST